MRDHIIIDKSEEVFTKILTEYEVVRESPHEKCKDIYGAFCHFANYANCPTVNVNGRQACIELAESRGSHPLVFKLREKKNV